MFFWDIKDKGKILITGNKVYNVISAAEKGQTAKQPNKKWIVVQSNSYPSLKKKPFEFYHNINPTYS